MKGGEIGRPTCVLWPVANSREHLSNVWIILFFYKLREIERRLFNAQPVASFQASTHCSLGSSGGPEQRTRLVPSDKCAASWGSEDAEMRMITARFIRVLLRYTDSLCTHYMFTSQQVMPLSKTCNRLSDNLWHYSGVLPPFRIGAGPFH
jgi:hypothetical protein